MRRARCALVAIVSFLAFTDVAVAQQQPGNSVAAPTAAPTQDQITMYQALRQQVITQLGAEAAGQDILLAPDAISAYVNIAITRYQAQLAPTEALRRRARPATTRQLGRYTTLYRRVVKRFGARKAGYNLRHGIRVCWRAHGKRMCHKRRATTSEAHRRIKAYRRMLHISRPASRGGAGWPPSVAAAFARIRSCESGGNYKAYGVGAAVGHYGAYQFDLQTWASVGGSGNPVSAGAAEQDLRAFLLWKRRGYQPWECARILGIG